MWACSNALVMLLESPSVCCMSLLTLWVFACFRAKAGVTHGKCVNALLHRTCGYCLYVANRRKAHPAQSRTVQVCRVWSAQLVELTGLRQANYAKLHQASLGFANCLNQAVCSCGQMQPE